VIASLVLATVSKVPFYIAGGVLALWAVVLAMLGLSRPEFPFGQGGQRVVIGVSVTLAAVAIALAIKTSSFGA
jgi:hypothetical protein